MSSPTEAWSALSIPWRVAFEEAWASCVEGSLGVGAVVTGDEGKIVARGRNQFFHEGPGRISQTYMAHAEMNAFIELPMGRRQRYELYTTFEPCSMCAVVAGHYRMTHIHYASPDPVFHGIDEWLRSAPWAERHYAPSTILGGPLGALGYLFHVWRILEAGWPSYMAESHELHAEKLYALASAKSTRATFSALAADHAPIPEVLSELWPVLEAASSLSE